MNQIRKYREAKGWTQEHLARISGVSQSTICQYELRERSVTLKTLDKLAAALEVPSAWLMEKEEVKLQDPKDVLDIAGELLQAQTTDEAKKKRINLMIEALKLEAPTTQNQAREE